MQLYALFVSLEIHPSIHRMPVFFNHRNFKWPISSSFKLWPRPFIPRLQSWCRWIIWWIQVHFSRDLVSPSVHLFKSSGDLGCSPSSSAASLCNLNIFYWIIRHVHPMYHRMICFFCSDCIFMIWNLSFESLDISWHTCWPKWSLSFNHQNHN